MVTEAKQERLFYLLDNCSAHMIDEAPFEHMESLFFPPNMMSVLQRVDAAIGRSFKAAFRRLLFDHFLAYIKPLKKLANPMFQVEKAVNIHDAVRMMEQAWDMVPKSFVLNAWL